MEIPIVDAQYIVVRTLFRAYASILLVFTEGVVFGLRLVTRLVMIGLMSIRGGVAVPGFSVDSFNIIKSNELLHTSASFTFTFRGVGAARLIAVTRDVA